MSQTLAPQPRVISSSKNRLAIVASQFNTEFTDALVEATIDELANVLPQARVDLIRVPGAYEIPLATKLILKNEEPAAVICLGVVIEGETAHADLITTAVTDQLLALSLEFETPVIHEVLLVQNEEQARARCMGAEMNRGRDSAHAAAAMVDVARELGRSRARAR